MDVTPFRFYFSSELFEPLGGLKRVGNQLSSFDELLFVSGLESGGMSAVSWLQREVRLVIEHISLC